MKWKNNVHICSIANRQQIPTVARFSRSDVISETSCYRRNFISADSFKDAIVAVTIHMLCVLNSRRQLYWLPVRQRVEFKVATLVLQALSGHVPGYLAASSPTLTQEDCARQSLVRFSSVGRAPTSATEPSVQLDLESGTICRRTSDSCICHAAVLDSR